MEKLEDIVKFTREQNCFLTSYKYFCHQGTLNRISSLLKNWASVWDGQSSCITDLYTQIEFFKYIFLKYKE